jgi:hypothetical protein
MKRIMGALAAAAMAFTVALLLAATPSAAAGYTLNFTGTVTSTSGLFSVLGSSSGDAVSGSITYDPFNSTVSGPILAGNSFNQAASSFTFQTEHPGVFNFSHADTGSGAVSASDFMAPGLGLFGDGSVSTLSLTLLTDGSGYTPLTSLAGFPTTLAGLIALLPGSVTSASGFYSVTGYGSVGFNLTIAAVATTPIPATLPLFAAGLAMLGYAARRRKSARAV